MFLNIKNYMINSIIYRVKLMNWVITSIRKKKRNGFFYKVKKNNESDVLNKQSLVNKLLKTRLMILWKNLLPKLTKEKIICLQASILILPVITFTMFLRFSSFIKMNVL